MRRNRQKPLRRVLAWCLLGCLLWPGLALTARADAVTDTITIAVGYYGWAEEEYIEKVSYHWTQLDDMMGGALDTQELIYSYYSGSRTYLVAARGFYIRDLLQYAGIDFGSIASVDFFTKDHSNGAYRSFSKYSLFDMPRYYFPNLAANEETGEIYPLDGDDIYNGAYRVEAMLALEDFTEWGVAGSEFEQLYDNSMLSPNCRFHLFFGQKDPTEASTSSAAKYCYKILITFSGTPVFSADETNLELKVGSGRKLEFDIDAEDGLLLDYVRRHITWTSSDPSVVSVAPDGTVTVNKVGTAEITASFGQSSITFTVGAGEEPGGDGGNGGSGTGIGVGTPVQQPSGDPPQAEPDVSTEVPAEPGIEIELPEPTTLPEEITPAKKVFTISPEALGALMSGKTEQADANGGFLDEGSEQLVLPLPEKNGAESLLWLLLLAALLGAGAELAAFRHQLKKEDQRHAN